MSGDDLRGAAEPVGSEAEWSCDFPTTHSYFGEKRTARQCCSSAMQLSVAVRHKAKERHHTQLSPKAYPATHPGQAGIWQLPFGEKANPAVKGIGMGKLVWHGYAYIGQGSRMPRGKEREIG